ncbi:MAG TPA: hypothetical protein VHV08_00275, partial [Pirellulales bacterium]|nr:hypothetical protein [Pirellulales bacterium]
GGGPRATYDLKLARLQPSADVAIVQMQYCFTGIAAAAADPPSTALCQAKWYQRLSGWFRRRRTAISATVCD